MLTTFLMHLVRFAPRRIDMEKCGRIYFDVLLLHARKCRRSRFYKNAAMMRNAATTADALKFAWQCMRQNNINMYVNASKCKMHVNLQCNALFGECNANTIEMCCNYVIMHDEKIHIGCTHTKCCWMQYKSRWMFTSNNVIECRRETCKKMRVNASQCDVSNVVLMR